VDFAKTALIVVDVQNDFCPGGALAVAGGDDIVPVINAMIPNYGACVLTQDWHPRDHTSFASQHNGKAPFDMVQVAYGDQVLWPDHCVQGSAGAAFHEGLNTDAADLVIRKGFRRDIDSYSAFFENDQTTATGLDGYLRTRGISSVVLTGLATDFCVFYSAMDAVKLGFDVHLAISACRGIDMDGSLDDALAKMRAAGVVFLD
jgi:nicotinamidase/pyrazinamidase